MNERQQKHESFETTGRALLATKPLNSTGTGLGKIGSSTLTKAAERLAAGHPRDNDKAVLNSVKSALGCSVELKQRTLFPKNAEPRTVIDGVAFSSEPTDMQLLEAERIAVLSLAPLPRTRIVQELLRLQVKTSSRNMDATRAELQLEVYADELEKYPADCVLLVLKLAGSEKWWPEWEALERNLTPLDGTRKTLLREIRKRLNLIGSEHQRGGMNSFGDLMKMEG